MDFSEPGNFEIDGFRLVLTCFACPEQYNVHLGDSQVGYLRLRHGYFTAYTPDHTGRGIYESRPIGDGIFENAREREQELREAIWAIDAELGRVNNY